MRLHALRLSFALLPLFVLGCRVSLTGERVTWYHDQAADEWILFVHYDGVHVPAPSDGVAEDPFAGTVLDDDRSDEDRPTKLEEAREELTRFAAEGGITLMGWPLLLDPADLREAIEKEADDPDEAAMARLLLEIERESVGWYREPDGHVGALQMVSIRRVSSFLERLNDRISAMILADAAQEGRPRRPRRGARTIERIRAAAAESHPWVELRGQALRVTLPVDPEEWLEAKRSWLQEMQEEGAAGRGGSPAQFLGRLLANAHFSWIEEDGRVTFVLGRESRAPLLRFAGDEDRYTPDLEATVVEAVGTPLDARLAGPLLDGATPDPTVNGLLKFGFPEEPVRALLELANDPDAARAARARDRLMEFTLAWNAAGKLPPAPLVGRDVGHAQLVEAWTPWYRQLQGR